MDAAPELTLAAPVPLNVGCFRYVDARLNDAALDELNKIIVVALQDSGIAAKIDRRNCLWQLPPRYARMGLRSTLRKSSNEAF